MINGWVFGFSSPREKEFMALEMYSSGEFMTGKCNQANTLSSYKLVQIDRSDAHIHKIYRLGKASYKKQDRIQGSFLTKYSLFFS